MTTSSVTRSVGGVPAGLGTAGLLLRSVEISSVWYPLAAVLPRPGASWRGVMRHSLWIGARGRRTRCQRAHGLRRRSGVQEAALVGAAPHDARAREHAVRADRRPAQDQRVGADERVRSDLDRR